MIRFCGKLRRPVVFVKANLQLIAVKLIDAFQSKIIGRYVDPPRLLSCIERNGCFTLPDCDPILLNDDSHIFDLIIRRFLLFHFDRDGGPSPLELFQVLF